MTTLVDAAVKPRLSAYVANIKARLRGLRRRPRQVPFYVMKSNGGVLSADEVVHQPITTVLSGPAAGALGAALIAQGRRLRPGAHLRRRRHVDRRLGRHRRRADADHRGHRSAPTRRKIPMIDVVTVGAGGGSIAWLSPEGTLKVGPQSAGADPGPLCYGKGGTEVDHHRRPRRARPDPAAPARRRDPARRRRRARPASRRSPRELGLRPRRCATGILEISAWNQANALRQVTVKRGLDVRDFTLTTFGGSGSLLLCRLIDILGLAGRAGAAEPRQRLGVRPAHRRREERLRADPRVARHDALDPAAVATTYDELTAQARRGADRARASRREQHAFVRTADLRYFGQAFEVRVAVPDGAGRRGRRSTAVAARVPRRAPRALRLRLPGDPRQQVEWVNLRVSGIGPIPRPEIREIAVAATATATSERARPRRARAGLLRRGRRVRRHPGRSGAPTCAPGDVVDRPGDHRGVRLDGAAAPGLHRPRRRVPATSIVTEEATA